MQRRTVSHSSHKVSLVNILAVLRDELAAAFGLPGSEIASVHATVCIPPLSLPLHLIIHPVPLVECAWGFPIARSDTAKRHHALPVPLAVAPFTGILEEAVRENVRPGPASDTRRRGAPSIPLPERAPADDHTSAGHHEDRADDLEELADAGRWSTDVNAVADGPSRVQVATRPVRLPPSSDFDSLFNCLRSEVKNIHNYILKIYCDINKILKIIL